MESTRCGKRPGCGAYLGRAARPPRMRLSRACGHGDDVLPDPKRPIVGTQISAPER